VAHYAETGKVILLMKMSMIESSYGFKGRIQELETAVGRKQGTHSCYARQARGWNIDNQSVRLGQSESRC
jgi:hypothetical protein